MRFVLVAHPAVFCFIWLMGIEYIIISNPFSCCCWISINLKQLAFSTVCSACELSCYEHSYTSHLCMYVYVYLFLFLLGRYLEVGTCCQEVSICLWKTASWFLKWLLFYALTSNVWGFQFLQILATVGILNLNCILLGMYNRTATW